jgi:hypothetical protein
MRPELEAGSLDMRCRVSGSIGLERLRAVAKTVRGANVQAGEP